MALTGTSRETVNARDQQRTFPVYEFATAVSFDIRQGDQLTLNTAPLVVQTVDEINGLLRVTAINA